MRRAIHFIGPMLIGALLLGCRGERTEVPAPSAEGPRPRVFVVNYPLYYFATRIAGDSAEVVFPAPDHVDPDFWRPRSETIEQYQQANLILVNGAGFGRWLDRATLPESRIRNTSESFRDQLIMLPDAIVHQHGPGGEHAHEGLASHTWLGPELARQQAAATKDALAQLLPVEADELESRWQALDRDLGDLEDEFRRLGESHPDLRIYASHPRYDYLARFCRWEVRNFHWEPDETPNDRQWETFAERHEEHGAEIMLWEAPPTAETAERLRNEFQVEPVPFYTLSNRPADGDYLSAMRENLARLSEALTAGRN
jgi:zinc transport system substrate-binding protein